MYGRLSTAGWGYSEPLVGFNQTNHALYLKNDAVNKLIYQEVISERWRGNGRNKACRTQQYDAAIMHSPGRQNAEFAVSLRSEIRSDQI